MGLKECDTVTPTDHFYEISVHCFCDEYTGHSNWMD